MKNSKGLILGLAAVLVAAGAGIYFSQGSRKAGERVGANGMRIAPELEVQRADGGKLALSDWSDHVVVVHFWATWCAPCIPEIPEILGAAKKLPKDKDGRPIRWLLVSQDTTWEKARTIVKDDSLPESVFAGLDPEAKASDAFGTYQFPETYLITRQGEVAAKWIGPQEWSGAWGEQALAGIESLSRVGKVPAPAQ